MSVPLIFTLIEKNSFNSQKRYAKTINQREPKELIITQLNYI